MKVYRMPEKFKERLPKDRNITLLALEGSRALGIENPNCDWDYRGVYVAKNEELLSLNQPPEQLEYNDKEMDYVIFEVGKFVRLALQCNPSIIGMLFNDKYCIRTDIGDLLVKNRNLFLSQRARKTFGGYALSQVLYLKRNLKFPDGKKLEKHVRHIFRLFDQGQELLETGKITVRLANPEKYYKIAERANDVEYIYRLFEERDKEFQACKSILPEKPDYYYANKILLKIRGFSI